MRIKIKYDDLYNIINYNFNRKYYRNNFIGKLVNKTGNNN